MFQVSILTPDKTLYEAEAYSVTLPGELGELTALPDHIPLITPLKEGKITIRTKKGDEFRDDTTDQFQVTGGILEIRKGNTLVVLAQQAKQEAE